MANWAALILIVALIWLKLSPNPEPRKHRCPWEKCPYKGVLPSQRAAAVREYTGSPEGSDAWCIDMLHLDHPQDDYETLENRLFKIQ